MKVLYLGLMTGDNGFTKAFKNNCNEYLELNCSIPNFNNSAKLLSDNFKPDLIFIQIQTPNIISVSTVIHLKNNGAFVINWTGDVRADIPLWYFELSEYVDLTCFSNMNDVHTFKRINLRSAYLEIGYDEKIFKPIGEKLPTKDIVFMGNNYSHFPLSKYRGEMIEFLRKNYPNNFAVYGNGWKNASGDFNNSQPNEAAIYRSAKIAINLNHFDYERYNSDRILRIMGTGAAMCLAKNYKGIEQDFTDGINLVTWNDFDELKESIDWYLKDDFVRDKIAKNGCKLMQEKFTFTEMIKNIINLVP